MKHKIILLFPIAIISLLLICNPSKPKSDWQYTPSRAYLSDSLPLKFIQNIKPVEHQGIKLTHSFGKSTYYFSYTANHQLLLKEISMLPFAADSVRADAQIRMINEIDLKKIKGLLDNPEISSQFLIEGKLEDYVAYECLKTPQHHILLLSKNSENVIHIIHQT